jgi:DNA (cytosine-5)-methyltransferase 1
LGEAPPGGISKESPAMHVLLRHLGEHRGAPRLYLDTTALATAGFTPGVSIDISCGTADEARLTIRVANAGKRKVSRKQRGMQEVPVIDINSQQDLQPFAAAGLVRVVIEPGAVHVLMPASVRKALARSARLAEKLALGQPLRTAGIAFGAGIASGAIHAGLAAGGVSSELALANEICEEYLDIGRQSNPRPPPCRCRSSRKTSGCSSVPRQWKSLRQESPARVRPARGQPNGGSRGWKTIRTWAI